VSLWIPMLQMDARIVSFYLLGEANVYVVNIVSTVMSCVIKLQ